MTVNVRSFIIVPSAVEGPLVAMGSMDRGGDGTVGAGGLEELWFCMQFVDRSEHGRK